jgi:molybdate transport system ATP-binding protein
VAVEVTHPPLTGHSPGLSFHARSALNPDFKLDVNFTAPPGITIIFGASGAGKTTILDFICGTKIPDSGLISTGDVILFDSAQNICRPIWERRVGYLFQDLALFPHLTARQNVEYGIHELNRNERHKRSSRMLDEFGVSGVEDRRPSRLSAGDDRTRPAQALVRFASSCWMNRCQPSIGRPSPRC